MVMLVAVVGAYGVHLLYTAVAYRWSGLTPGPTPAAGAPRRRQLGGWLTQAGLGSTRPRELVAVVVTVGALGAAFGAALFGGVVAPAVVGLCCGAAPVLVIRRRRRERRRASLDAWPRVIEEIRLLTASAGRSVPQAAFEAGRNGSGELREAFSAASREWALSTDFARALGVVKHRLADPTADAACETLLVAHEVGGTDLDRRLDALAADRRAELQSRHDARARLAGVRFARRFTLLVPLGMAATGLAIGNGRAAYEAPEGQALVGVALICTAACWWWAGRLMRLPEPDRVFTQVPAP